jgi:hypothetical protein
MLRRAFIKQCPPGPVLLYDVSLALLPGLRRGPDKSQTGLKAWRCWDNRLVGGGGIREDGEVLSRMCLHRRTRACYEQRNICVHLQHAPFCTVNKSASGVSSCTLTAAMAVTFLTYIQEAGHQLSSLTGLAVLLQCLQANAVHLQTGYERFFTNPSNLAAHAVFFSLSMPSRSDSYIYSWAISMSTVATGPREKNCVKFTYIRKPYKHKSPRFVILSLGSSQSC